MEKLTVEELCKFVETFGKKEIGPSNTLLYSFRVWLEGPDFQTSDDFRSIEQRFIDFIIDNKFRYDHDKNDTLELTRHHILKDGLPEGVDFLIICMPGEQYDNYMGKDSLILKNINNKKVCLYPRRITIMMRCSKKK